MLPDILIHSIEAFTIFLVLLAVLRIYKHYSAFIEELNNPKGKSETNIDTEILIQKAAPPEKKPNAVLDDYIGNFF